MLFLDERKLFRSEPKVPKKSAQSCTMKFSQDTVLLAYSYRTEVKLLCPNSFLLFVKFVKWQDTTQAHIIQVQIVQLSAKIVRSFLVFELIALMIRQIGQLCFQVS